MLFRLSHQRNGRGSTTCDKHNGFLGWVQEAMIERDIYFRCVYFEAMRHFFRIDF